MDRSADRQAYTLTDGWAHNLISIRQTNVLTKRLLSIRQTNILTDIPTYRQKDKHIDRPTNI